MSTIMSIIGVLLGLGFLGVLAIIGLGVLLLAAIWLVYDTIKSLAGKKQKGEWY